ncbi:MAG TPA: hypothetical protein VHS74_05610 [Solirubrobacterales bacterium]|nr:hypothetical protein [Solirubrobacterales bacterium]
MAFTVLGVLAVAGCGGGGNSTGPGSPPVVTYNSLEEALGRAATTHGEDALQDFECGSGIEELQAESVEKYGGVEGGCTGHFANGLGEVSIPYNVTINPNWCFVMEVPAEAIDGISEGGEAPIIEGTGAAESDGAEAAGGVLGNVTGCVHPKPEGE